MRALEETEICKALVPKRYGGFELGFDTSKGFRPNQEMVLGALFLRTPLAIPYGYLRYSRTRIGFQFGLQSQLNM